MATLEWTPRLEVGFLRIDHHKLLHPMLLDRFRGLQAEVSCPAGRLALCPTWGRG
ncbi:MAG: hypothetical protein GY745_09090 [Actinomycetia bacterium]|nr:hypothetical protein [Actinomycetes bacterium]MCP4085188.1 hypothetical protein [Actinomycetes bacterium]